MVVQHQEAKQTNKQTKNVELDLNFEVEIWHQVIWALRRDLFLGSVQQLLSLSLVPEDSQHKARTAVYFYTYSLFYMESKR